MSNITSIRGGAFQSTRILVVEDNLDAVHSMALLIKMMGHECQFAINGFAALKIAREFRPEIILLDIGLPDLKGYDIARQLKYEPGLEQTRIIAITRGTRVRPAARHRRWMRRVLQKALGPRVA